MDIVQKSNSNCDHFPPSSVSYRSYLSDACFRDTRGLKSGWKFAGKKSFKSARGRLYQACVMSRRADAQYFFSSIVCTYSLQLFVLLLFNCLYFFSSLVCTSSLHLFVLLLFNCLYFFSSLVCTSSLQLFVLLLFNCLYFFSSIVCASSLQLFVLLLFNCLVNNLRDTVNLFGSRIKLAKTKLMIVCFSEIGPLLRPEGGPNICCTAIQRVCTGTLNAFSRQRIHKQ
jgi:hypothetical protein